MLAVSSCTSMLFVRGLTSTQREALSLETPDADCCNLGNPAGPAIWAALTHSPAGSHQLLPPGEQEAGDQRQRWHNESTFALLVINGPEKSHEILICNQIQTKTSQTQVIHNDHLSHKRYQKHSCRKKRYFFFKTKKGCDFNSCLWVALWLILTCEHMNTKKK